MKYLSCIFLICLSTNIVCSQSSHTNDLLYTKNIILARAALEESKFDSCMIYYKEAFTVKQSTTLIIMHAAACGYGAFDVDFLEEQLGRAFELNWHEAKQVFYKNPEFHYLKDTPFEDMVINAHEDALLEKKESLTQDTMLIKKARLKEDVVTILSEEPSPAGKHIVTTKEVLVAKESLELTEDSNTEELKKSQQEKREFKSTYGSQSLQIDSSGVIKNPMDSLHAVPIIEMIDSLRATMGLGPLREHTKLLELAPDFAPPVSVKKPSRSTRN